MAREPRELGLFDPEGGLIMAFSHYVDIMIREGVLAHELHARLLLAVHYRVAAAGGKLAVAWPDWRDRPGEFGLLFRVFGAEDALSGYLETIAPLAVAALVRPYPVLPVPGSAATVRYLRDRSYDKLSPSAARRLAERAAARGETWKSTHADNVRSGGDHYLTIPSASRNQMFRCYVRRDRGAVDATSGSSYGLGYALPDF